MENRPFVPAPVPRQPRRARAPYRSPHPPIAPFWPEKTPAEKEAEKNARETRKINGLFAASASTIAAVAALRLLSHTSHKHGFQANEYDMDIKPATAETSPLQPVHAKGFERGPLGAPTNEEVASVEQSILPVQYRIPIRFVTVGDAPRPMPTEYGINQNEDAHCDTGQQEIVIGPQIIANLPQQSGDYLYKEILFHENGHAFNWYNAPSLTPEQRASYQATFVHHIQDGTPRIRSTYVDAIHNHDPAIQLERKSVEYQAELVEAILSLPFPEYRTGTWDEALAQKLHELHQIPLKNARFEVRLFRWMIELVFPGRSPEAMHREVQAATRRAVEQGSYRINTAVLHQTLAPDLQQVTDQAFTIPTNETWLRHYAEASGTSVVAPHHRYSVRRELLQQQADRLNNIRHEIGRRSEHASLVIDLFQQADYMGRNFHHHHVPTRSAQTFNETYQRLSAHDRQVVQYYLPTYGQLLQYKPSLYQISPTLAQAAHTTP